MCCTVEVDVNGEHIFFVNKKLLASYSNRLSKFSSNFASTRQIPRVIFHDFPGGAESFEFIASFCYNNGYIEITPSNIFLLHCGGKFMEMNSLIKQTELFLEGTHSWTWSEFISGLKQCRLLFPSMNSSPVFQDFLNFILGNLTLPSYITSSCTSSSDSSSFRLSSSDLSTKSSRFHLSQNFWQLEDLSFLNIDLFEKLIKSMIFLRFDHPTICSFIFCYQKSRYFLCSSLAEKCNLSETNINLLCLLNVSSFSCRGILDAFGTSLNLEMRTHERAKLVNLLGSRLDEFTINDLLFRGKKNCAFDVDLTLRFLQAFLLERRINGFFLHRAKKVGSLIDLYMAEVVPDPSLKPTKLIALAKALPDCAREYHDKLYHAIDLYLEVHCGLTEEQKMSLCHMVNPKKLSLVTLSHLARNTKFPQSLTSDSLFFQQPELRSFCQDDSMAEKISCRPEYRDNRTFKLPPKSTQTAMPMKSRVLNLSNAKYLPRICH